MTESLPPGGPQALVLDEILGELERVEGVIRKAEAERVRLLAAAFDVATIENDDEDVAPVGAGANLAYRAIRAEIAAVLHESEATVERRIGRAVTLTQDYPGVFEAYRSGRISERHATVITDAGAVIGTGRASGADTDTDADAVANGDVVPDTGHEYDLELRRAAYAAAVLPVAIAETPPRLRPIARRLAEEYAPVSLDERHEAARQQRRVWVEDREDGMADLWAHLPAVEAHAIKDRLTRMAVGQAEAEAAAEATAEAAGRARSDARDRSITQEAGEIVAEARTRAPRGTRRSRDATRADILADLLLGRGQQNGADGGDGDSAGDTSPASASPVQAVVQVVIGAGALDLPEIEGYGPIDTSTARQLAGDASHWEMIRVGTDTGEVLAVDRYRPSEAMRRLLRARDQHCRFPGCRVPVTRCDLDHTVDAALGGATSTANLGFLCRGHHVLKHHTGWRVEQTGRGVFRWTSPTARSYEDHPPGQRRRQASRVRFTSRWPIPPEHGWKEVRPDAEAVAPAW